MKLISGVFHPLLMATYSSILFYWLIPEFFIPVPREAIPFFILAVFVTTAAIPALSILFLRMTSRISNLEITRREERSLPFLSIGAFYGLTTYLFFSKMSISAPFLVMMITVTAMILLIFLISLKQKISVHSAGIWGVAGFISALGIKYLSTDIIVPLVAVFLIAGITTTSRLYLGRHTPTESWSGAILGFTLCFLSFVLFG